MWFWGTLGILSVAHLVFWLTDFKRSVARLPGLIEKAKAQGFATTAEEYARLQWVEEGANAAPVYKQIIDEVVLLLREQPEAVEMLGKVVSRTASIDPYIRSDQVRFQRIVSLTREAATYPLFRVPPEWESGDRIEQLAKPLRIASKVQVAEVKALVHRGQFDEALAVLKAMSDCLGHGLPEPRMLDWLIAISTRVYWFYGLSVILEHGYSTTGVLAECEHLLKQLRPLVSIRQALRGEVYFAFNFRKKLSERGLAILFATHVPLLARLPYFKSELAFDAFVADGIEELTNLMAAAINEHRHPVEIAQMFQPSWYAGHWWIRPGEIYNRCRFSNPASTLMSYLARQKLALLGIEIYKYRLQYGQFPETIESILRGHAKDPYTHFQYKRTLAGFELRSGNLIY